MAARPSAKALVYQSVGIHERRKRILREARLMVLEVGYENFNIRELAVRAGVALKTLYNAFDSKESIIACSIIGYAQEFSDNIRLKNDEFTLRGKLERLIKVHSRNLQIRPYATAIMTLYNSPSADPTIREAIRDISVNGHIAWAERLAVERRLVDHVGPRDFAQRVASATYSTLTEWCVGEIPDERMVGRIAESVLMVVAGTTRGALKAEAEAWLKIVRAEGPAWGELRLQAQRRGASPPQPGANPD
jgi:AcrR family transcriptional regulator